MIGPICIKCKKELSNYGAIIVSPPLNLNKNDILTKNWKMHICQNCYYKIEKWFNDKLKFNDE